MNDGLWTRSVERLLAAEPAAVRAAIARLAERLWPGHRVLVDEPRLVVHGIADVWVTWELAGVPDHAGWTLVRIVHDEIDEDGSPPPDLTLVLDVLARDLAASIPP